MCGICGIVHYDHTPIETALMEKMCRSFACRGPDDEGVYASGPGDGGSDRVQAAFGHRRLSIIDLSAAGHQPMSNETDAIWVTYNGEIYNFKDLKRQLLNKGHRFKSDTDTEVILHLYEEVGTAAVQEFNGMFAFGLWDAQKEQLWVCRDRLGIKPLVYYWDGKHFAFASEIKALLCDPLVPKELDVEALQLYLAFNYIPAPYTIFKGIRKLAPGCFLVLKDQRLTVERYWDISPRDDLAEEGAAFNDQLESFKGLLFRTLSQAVEKRLIADVPLGAFLSGGIDSSVIVALMSRYSSKPVQTFSIGFKDASLYDETRYAREVACLYRTDHHEFKLTHRDMLDVFPEVLSTFDEPFADSSAVPTYIVSRETRRHVTVALSGDGGDELFAGYRSYLGEYWYRRYRLIPAFIRTGLIEALIQMVPDSRDVRALEYVRRLKKFIRSTRGSFSERVLAVKEVFPQDIRRSILSVSDAALETLPLQHIQKQLGRFGHEGLNSILYADARDSLPGDMLTKVDWMSMKNSLEVRVPFLDYHVVELAFQMPAALKLYRGETKYILKETFKDLLPKTLHHRPKAGFEIPISRWLKTDLKFLLDQYLDAGRIKKQGIFNHDTIAGLIRRHETGRTDTSWMLWNLIVFQYWYDEYFL
ncbi:MAG: asparagine synthase (glutamine-hydrolyzing) [Thermodesulfobacteriota bacterium]